MKFYRYMSLEEFVKMSMGKNMQANYHQQFTHNNTDSKGFCFLASTIVGKSTRDNNKTYKFSAEESLKFLSGIVCDEILVEFEENDIVDGNWGYGIYNSFYDPDDMKINEYSLMEYNKSVLKPLRYVISPNDVNIQDNIWEEFSEKKDYTIKDMISLFAKKRASPYTDGYLNFTKNLKLLPTMPNSSSDNIWRILQDKEEGIDSLVYGNPITEEKIYELKFDSKAEKIDFGENIPEFWQPLKTLYDNNPNLSRSHTELFEMAALVASYPQILERFEIMIEDDEKWGPSIYLKNNDTVLSTNDLSFSLKEDDTLDITYLDEEDYQYKSIIENPLPQKSEHTATEIGEYASSIGLDEFTQGLQVITSGDIPKEQSTPSKE